MRLPDSWRHALERASRNVSLRRRLPARFGGSRLHVSPGAALCYYRPLSEATWHELFDFAEHCVRPGTTVWDVGASMGVFGFAAAHSAGPKGHVLFVEADTWAAALLKKSAQAAGPALAPAQVLCAAVGAQLSIQSFNIPERGRAGSHLAGSSNAGRSLLGGTRESHPTLVVTLDWLATQFPPPAAIKLDVEGSELAALESGGKLLAEHHPALYVEVYERNADAVTHLLHGFGYKLFDISAGWAKRVSITRATYNTLALAE